MIRARHLLVAVVVLACAGESSAQPAPGVPGPPRPVFSPYLNLARRDAPPAVNYYGIVRPQFATYNAIQSFQQQLSSVQQTEAQPAVGGGLPVTGQPAFFLNTGGYFLNNRAGVGPVNPSVTTRSAPFTPPPMRPGRR